MITRIPITVQIHIPPPSHPPIHPLLCPIVFSSFIIFVSACSAEWVLTGDRVAGAKAENAANRFGDHDFFVAMDDADSDPAGIRGNYAFIRLVSLFFEFNAKKFQPGANPGADRGRVLSDAAREHQRAQPSPTPPRRRRSIS